MRGAIDHIVLTVRDPEASFDLYDTVLRYLGYGLVGRNEAGMEWVLEADGASSVCLVKARDAGAARQHDRYAPGLHHLAWRAASREDVDHLHALLVEQGAEVLDAPADYPQYNGGRGYYAVFFADGDGLKLEYVFAPVG